MNLEQLQEMLWSFAGHRLITVAAKTGILAHLVDNEADVASTAQTLGLDEAATAKTIRALTALGLLEHNNNKYRVAGELQIALGADNGYFLPFFEHSHHLYDSWGASLEPWLRGEQWQRKKRDLSGIEEFGAAMEAMGSHVATLLADALDLEGAKNVLDVGGGFGHYTKALLDRSPSLTGTVIDIPEVAELGKKRVQNTIYAERLNFEGGDYLTTKLDRSFDMVMLINVLHQESQDRAWQMIQSAHGHLAPGGRLVVLDFSIDDAKQEHLLGTLFAINMRSFGDTYSEPEIREWLTRIGLIDIERKDLNSHRWLISGRKPA